MNEIEWSQIGAWLQGNWQILLFCGFILLILVGRAIATSDQKPQNTQTAWFVAYEVESHNREIRRANRIVVVPGTTLDMATLQSILHTIERRYVDRNMMSPLRKEPVILQMLALSDIPIQADHAELAAVRTPIRRMTREGALHSTFQVPERTEPERVRSDGGGGMKSALRPPPTRA